MVFAAFIFCLVTGLLALAQWVSVRRALTPTAADFGSTALVLPDVDLAAGFEPESPYATGPPLLLKVLTAARTMQDISGSVQFSSLQSSADAFESPVRAIHQFETAAVPQTCHSMFSVS